MSSIRVNGRIKLSREEEKKERERERETRAVFVNFVRLYHGIKESVRLQRSIEPGSSKANR